MSWNLYLFNSAEKYESACKEIYDNHYLKTYTYCQWLISNPSYAKDITLHTLLQVCRHGNLYNEEALLARVRRIATYECLDYLKKATCLEAHYKEYLAHNKHSAELLKAAFNSALLREKQLKEWKQLSPAEQEEIISDHTASNIPLNFLL